MSNRQAVIVRLSIIHVVIVVVMVGRIMMVMMVPVAMVTMKGVILIAVLVGVDNAVGEDASRHCGSQTDGGCQGKHERHRPDQGEAPSALSLQSYEHARSVS